MRRTLLGIVCATGILLASAASALAASDNASCVGQFSTFFAHGGGGIHRSEIARDFAHNARPAGANVYSHIAQLHGDLRTLVPYPDPYRCCLMCLMRLLDVLVERG